MDPPKPRKKREASLKKREKGHVYSARHTRIALEKACKKCPGGSKDASGSG